MATKSKKTKKGNGTAVAKTSKKKTKKITSNIKKTTKTAKKK